MSNQKVQNRKYSLVYKWGERARLKKLAKFSTGRVLDIGYSGQPNPFLKGAYGLDVYVPTEKPQNYTKLVKVNTNNPYRYPFKDNFFDCVIAGEVIEHIPNLDAFMKEVHRILKQNGIFCLSTPNPESPVEVLIHVWHWIKGYDFTNGAKGYHVHEFPTTNMISLLNIYGFKPFKIEGSYIQIPFTQIQIPLNLVPLTYCTVYFARCKK